MVRPVNSDILPILKTVIGDNIHLLVTGRSRAVDFEEVNEYSCGKENERENMSYELEILRNIDNGDGLRIF